MYDVKCPFCKGELDPTGHVCGPPPMRQNAFKICTICGSLKHNTIVHRPKKTFSNCCQMCRTVGMMH